MKDESFDSDIMYILYIMLGFFVLIVLRRFLMNKISEYLTKKENTATSEEITLTNEINKLKREAEIYNNPQSYVKYAKLERQITKLQRQLEDIVSTKPVQENDNISKVAYLKVGMQLVFYVINVIFIYSFKDKQLNIKGDVLNNNIVFDYFNKDGFTSIPFYMILVMGGMFISNILDNLEKIKKIIA